MRVKQTKHTTQKKTSPEPSYKRIMQGKNTEIQEKAQKLITYLQC